MSIRRWLLVMGLGISIGMGLWYTRPSTTLASGTFTISQSFPGNGATNVPVNLLSQTYHPSFGYANQSVSMALNGLPTNCQINRPTFKQQTVQLTSTSDQQTYFLTAPGANVAEAIPWLAVTSPTIGFELLPFTSYQLTLHGGASGIAFTCSGQDYYLNQDFQTSFTTGADTVAPQIMGPQAQATSTTAVVHWETFQAASGQVAYGLTSTNLLANQNSTGTLHRVELANLQPGTNYVYQIRSQDAAGNTATSNGHFTTVGLGEIKVSDITDMAATIQWTSNQPTDSIIEFGTSQAYGNRQGNGGQITNHTWRMTGLQPDTTYHFRIVATNSNGSSVFVDNVFATVSAATVAGNGSGQAAGISTSNDNIKLFPQVSFQPFVLGASRAASVLGDTIAVGRNLLTGKQSAPDGGWGWVAWLWWILPLILLVLIGGLWWHIHRQTKAKQASDATTPTTT